MIDRTRQAESWTSPYGTTKVKNLVGQIYFPFDNDHLDENDKTVLGALADHFIIALLGTRVSMRFEGHCDYRGSTSYNRALAERRAKAVQAYVDSKLKRSSRFFSSSTVSFGEKYAGRTDIDYDRRVDIHSSFVMTPPPIVVPPLKITGTIPKKLTRRPVEFLDIEHHRLFAEDGPHSSVPPWHTIILEKYEMIDATYTFPYDMRVVDTTVHKILPTIQVHRYRIKWRKPKPSDTAKKVAAVLLNILAGAAGTAGGYDFGPGVPALKPPNIVYKSWAEFAAKPGATDYLKYRGKAF